MIMFYYMQSIVLTCNDLDCSGYDCELFQILGTHFQVPICMCEKKKFVYDCSRCRNIRFDAQDDCNTCINKDHDEKESCKLCKNGIKYDTRNCNECIDVKYKRDNCNNQCSNTNLDITKDCNDCIGTYVYFKKQCISNMQQNFVQYFGLIFSHTAVIALLFVLLIINKRKQKQQQQFAQTKITHLPNDSNCNEPSEFTIIENNDY